MDENNFTERLKTTGRNDPCPCGSGKKYKKCHLESDERLRHEETVKQAEEAEAAAAAAQETEAEKTGDNSDNTAKDKSRTPVRNNSANYHKGLQGKNKTNIPRRGAV